MKEYLLVAYDRKSKEIENFYIKSITKRQAIQFFNDTENKYDNVDFVILNIIEL